MQTIKQKQVKQNYVQRIISQILTVENLAIVFQTKNADLQSQKKLMQQDFIKRNKIRTPNNCIETQDNL